MHYTLHQLRIYHLISIHQSITKTAEELHLTQPAVSIQLKNFQSQFDIPLIEIIGRKVYLTDLGKEVAMAAEKILEEVEKIDHRVKAFKGELYGKLKISVVSTGKYVMPFFLTDFLKYNPGVQLLLDVTNKSKVLESLEKNEVDFALVSILPDKIPVHAIQILDNQLFLVGSAQCELNEPKYSDEILSQIPLIFREQGSGTRQMMEQFLENNQISVQRKIELTSNEAVKQAVIAGLGFSIMPYIGIKNEIKIGLLKIIPVEGLPMNSKWNLIHHQSKQLSPVATEFIKYLSKNKDNIRNKQF